MAVYKTKVEIVYDAILEKIANGAYQTGDRLIISQVARENSVSDIPVREAIRLLEKEGYVETHANQGSVIHSLTKESLTEVFQLRAVLEGYAARQSVDYLGPKDFAELRQINRKLATALETRDGYKRYSQLNMDFHLRLYSVVPQKMLHDMILDLWKRYSITKAVFSLVPGHAVSSVAEHEELLQLMEQKQYDQVETLMRTHKMQAGEALRSQMEQRETHKAE